MRNRTVASCALRVVLGVLAGCVALVLPAGALATAGLSVKSHDWEIGINDGPTHKVPANGTFKFCASKTVGAITPKIDLSAAPVGEAYSFGLAGPAAAGNSLATEGESFTNAQGGVIAPAFIPLTFPKLKAKDATSFPAGAYRFTLTVSGAPALTEKVKLVRRAGC